MNDDQRDEESFSLDDVEVISFDSPQTPPQDEDDFEQIETEVRLAQLESKQGAIERRLIGRFQELKDKPERIARMLSKNPDDIAGIGMGILMKHSTIFWRTVSKHLPHERRTAIKDIGYALDRGFSLREVLMPETRAKPEKDDSFVIDEARRGMAEMASKETDPDDLAQIAENRMRMDVLSPLRQASLENQVSLLKSLPAEEAILGLFDLRCDRSGIDPLIKRLKTIGLGNVVEIAMSLNTESQFGLDLRNQVVSLLGDDSIPQLEKGDLDPINTHRESDFTKTAPSARFTMAGVHTVVGKHFPTAYNLAQAIKTRVSKRAGEGLEAKLERDHDLDRRRFKKSWKDRLSFFSRKKQKEESSRDAYIVTDILSPEKEPQKWYLQPMPKLRKTMLGITAGLGVFTLATALENVKEGTIPTAQPSTVQEFRSMDPPKLLLDSVENILPRKIETVAEPKIETITQITPNLETALSVQEEDVGSQLFSEFETETPLVNYIVQRVENDKGEIEKRIYIVNNLSDDEMRNAARKGSFGFMKALLTRNDGGEISFKEFMEEGGIAKSYVLGIEDEDYAKEKELGFSSAGDGINDLFSVSQAKNIQEVVLASSFTHNGARNPGTYFVERNGVPKYTLQDNIHNLDREETVSLATTAIDYFTGELFKGDRQQRREAFVEILFDGEKTVEEVDFTRVSAAQVETVFDSVLDHATPNYNAGPEPKTNEELWNSKKKHGNDTPYYAPPSLEEIAVGFNYGDADTINHVQNLDKEQRELLAKQLYVSQATANQKDNDHFLSVNDISELTGVSKYTITKGISGHRKGLIQGTHGGEGTLTYLERVYTPSLEQRLV